MKHPQLKRPFTWKERRVLLQDRVLHVPDFCDHYSSFSFPAWEHPDLFGNNHPVNVEYCSGNGGWIAEKALAHPELNWVAVECKFTRVQKIWNKINSYQLKNLLIVSGEGFLVTQHYFNTHTVDHVFINFPDPWPKTKHAKNRIIQTPFIEEISRILKKEGTLTFVTDDVTYSEWTIQTVMKNPTLVTCHPEPYFVTEHSNYGRSYFEQFWRERGRTIRYHRFSKS